MTLGIVDWGCGGLTLLKPLMRARPDLHVVYVADQASQPYDSLGKEALAERLRSLNRVFAGCGIDRVVFACDAASTLLSELTHDGVTVSGIIEPTIRAMRRRKFREVGIIGGRRTILSGVYGRTLRRNRILCVQRVSLELTERIEKGLTEHDETIEHIQTLLDPLCKVDALILANSHYAIARDIIQSSLPKAELIVPVEETLRELVRDLPRDSVMNGSCHIYSTGEPSDFRKHIHMALGTIVDVHPIQSLVPKLAA